MAKKAAQNASRESAAKSTALPSPSAGRRSRPQGIADTLLGLQRTHGNRYVQGVVGKMMLRRKSLGAGSGAQAILRREEDPSIAPPIVHETLQSSGRPLEPTTRSFMESRLNRNFSRVRVHTDERAAQSATAVNAAAYTVGRDVVFGPGQYSPATGAGKRLIAHELSHVSDQSATGSASAIKIGEANDHSEREADRQADRAMAGHADGALQRKTTGDAAAKDSGPVVRRSKLGAGIGAGVGALALGGLGLALGAGVGAIALGVLGLVAGGLIGDALSSKRRQPRPASGPGPSHLETNAPDVQLVGDPNQAQATLLRTLPTGTRVVITDEGLNEPFNSSGAQWVKIRVTTGTDMGAEGWLQRTQLTSRAETTEVTDEVAARLYVEMAQSTFTTQTGGRAPIPFHYPVDGCYARAHSMSDLLTEKGYASEKVFAVSRATAPGGGLRVPTPFGGDVAAGGEPAVRWWYHVAPIIKVRDDNGNLVEKVLDPSIAPGPVTIEGWTRLMNSEPFTRKTLDEIDAMLESEGNYPSDRNLTFTAPREAYTPPQPGRPLMLTRRFSARRSAIFSSMDGRVTWKSSIVSETSAKPSNEKVWSAFRSWA